MLKFTKYGKKASAGEGGSNSLTSSSTIDAFGTLPRKKLPSAHGSTDDAGSSTDSTRSNIAKGLRESQVLENSTTTVVTQSVSFSSHQKQSLSDKDLTNPNFNVMKPLNSHQSHLKLSKVPKDELVKMDSEMKLESSSKPVGKRARSTAKEKDDNQSNMKISRPSMVTLKNAFDLQSSIKVPVFNDGYFPKIHPLNKLFSMRRAK
ncbi:unnamed protein product [Orchesella dallaii]|uniref:Uncharacterized protein n=1 Tax=Orchesella dallaii TaxID=48710 RepID=A0ABP1QK03_9HEXA